jgi:hypothetical protein
MQIAEVKKHMADKTKVNYADGEYIITACIMRILNGNWYYQLELKDIKANSVIITNMEAVEC